MGYLVRLPLPQKITGKYTPNPDVFQMYFTIVRKDGEYLLMGPNHNPKLL